ncbi:MAG: NAD-dependent epimerase/dehydratase family protein [Gammaproteobacteria bacterium]|nr:NAD-dependent epimerase/dehydratase family protein [Gammaproteobacteria bacterium]MDH5728220.1 NAD-dependent epimerase/dehydratase family protein [Gammaproteobacteria bacterium]
MRVFITGASGFLGARVLKQVLQKSWHATILLRDANKASAYENDNIRVVLGDLENLNSWKSTLESIDVVIHCAAPLIFWGPWRLYEQGIVQATQGLFQAAEQATVKRFVFISSESVLQDRKPLLDIDESEPYPKQPNSYYGLAKKQAEQLLLKQDSATQVIILRPTFIWGVGVAALETMKAKIASKQFMWVDHGRSMFEMVHVDNVAHACVLACESGQDKGVYFITDDAPQTVQTFLSKLFQAKQISNPNKNIPRILALLSAIGCETLWRLFGLKSTPPITRFDVAFVAMPRRYKIDRAKRELAYRPVIDQETGLKQLT